MNSFLIISSPDALSFFNFLIQKNSKRPRKNIKSRWTLLLENIDKKWRKNWKLWDRKIQRNIGKY
jgi:hypothetical protein